MKNVFINCNLIDGKGGDIVPNVAIFVDNTKIVDISSDNKNYKGYEVIDLKGKYIMPGLINAHAHLFGTGMPSKVVGGGPLQKKVIKFVHTPLGNKVLDLLVSKSAKQQLNSGVTTLRTAGDFCYSDVRLRDAINSGKKVGPRLLVPGPAITVSGGHGDGTFAITADSLEGLRQCVRTNVEHNVDVIKICVTGGVMDAKKKGEPGEVKMNVDQTTAICEEAHKNGLKVASHTESPDGVKVCIASKVDTIEHGSALDEKMVEDLKAYGGVLVPTLTPALVLAKLSPEVTKLSPMCVYNSEVVFDNMLKGAKTSLANGMIIGSGTDASCPFVSQYNTWKELYYLTRYLDISVAKAINILTMGNANVLGLEDKIGSIEKGKEADMIVANNNPYEDVNTLGKLFMVIKGGDIIKNPKVKKNKYIEENLEEVGRSIP